MKLQKDINNAMIFGVCAGLSKYTGIDVSFIRTGLVIGAFITGSLVFWIYLLMAIVLPKENISR